MTEKYLYLEFLVKSMEINHNKQNARDLIEQAEAVIREIKICGQKIENNQYEKKLPLKLQHLLTHLCESYSIRMVLDLCRR